MKTTSDNKVIGKADKDEQHTTDDPDNSKGQSNPSNSNNKKAEFTSVFHVSWGYRGGP